MSDKTKFQEKTIDALDAFRDELKEYAAKVTDQASLIERMADSLDEVRATLYRGDGKEKAVLVTVAVLQEQLHRLNKSSEDAADYISADKRASKELALAKTQGRNKLIITVGRVLVAIAAAAGALMHAM